jgi:hypothetical protein
MTVRLSASGSGHALPSRKIPGTHFYYGLSKPQAIAMLARFGKKKKETMTSLGF